MEEHALNSIKGTSILINRVKEEVGFFCPDPVYTTQAKRRDPNIYSFAECRRHLGDTPEGALWVEVCILIDGMPPLLINTN